jgi:hypothetical protein
MNETHASSPKAEPFSAAQAVAAGVDLPNCRLGANGLFWNEYRPQDGACRIWHWRDGTAKCLTPWVQRAQPGVRIWRWRVLPDDDGVVFVNEADQQLYRHRWTANPKR